MLRYSKDVNINGGQEVFTAGEVDHARMRRVLSHGFSENAIRGQEPMVQVLVALLVQRLRERSHERGKVDISGLLEWALFDITGDLVFGESFGCLQKNESHPWVALLDGFLRYATYFAVLKQFPRLNYVIRRLLPASLLQKLSDHQRLAIERINRRLESGSDRDDILNIILKHNGTEREMSREDIYSNANLLILAGSETTSTAIAGCVYFLAQNPQVQYSLKNEICSRFACEEEITFEALSNLTYLTAVLDESMRLYPAVPNFTPRVTPSGGAVVAGHFVPENVSTSISSPSI